MEEEINLDAIQKEFIVCSAVKFRENVVCGLRHSDCISTITRLNPLVKWDEIPDRKDQGFLTSRNRYVTRKEAYKIAFDNNQIIGPNKGYPDNEFGLTSEDLFY